MDRLSVLLAWWEHLERRSLPAACPRPMRYLVVTVVLIATIAALGRDLAYLRSIPGIVPIDDVFAYECYARAFWRGSSALLDAPHVALCGDHRWLFWTAPPSAFHTLPREYPAPALAVFSLPLLWPFAPYGLVYMVLFGLLVFAVTAWLVTLRLELSAAAFSLYVLAGGWATALARFDLAPGVLVLCALVLAERHRYLPAYLLLAAATLLKIYPGFVVLVLATHQWRASGTPPRREMSAFALALGAGLLPAVVLNSSGLLGPLHYNALRPPQIESVAGSLLWLSGKLGGDVQVRLTYHSVNVLGMLAGAFAWLATLLLVGGLALVCLRAWHGRDSLGRSFVVVLLVTLCGSKLLSPQYLLWIFPVVAYVEGLRLRWLLVALLTLVIFPNAYALDISLVRLPEHPLFMGSILARNGLLVVLAVYYLWASPLAAASAGAFGEHRVDAGDEHVPGEGIAIGGLTAGEG